MTTYVPRGAFRTVTNNYERTATEPHAFGRLDLIGTNGVKLVGFPFDVVESLERELHGPEGSGIEYSEKRQNEKGESEVEWTLWGKPWKEESIRTDILVTLICAHLHRHAFRPKTGLRIPPKQHPPIVASLNFSRPLRSSSHPSSQRSVFAVTFPSATWIRVVSAPSSEEAHIVRQISRIWAADIKGERRLGDGCFEIKLKSPSFFSSNSKSDTQAQLHTLIAFLDGKGSPLLTSFSLHSHSSSPDFYLFDCPAGPIRTAAETAPAFGGGPPPPTRRRTVSAVQFSNKPPPTILPASQSQSRLGRGFSFLRRSKQPALAPAPVYSAVTTTTTTEVQPTTAYAPEPQTVINGGHVYRPAESVPFGAILNKLKIGGRSSSEEKEGGGRKGRRKVEVEEVVDVDSSQWQSADEYGAWNVPAAGDEYGAEESHQTKKLKKKKGGKDKNKETEEPYQSHYNASTWGAGEQEPAAAEGWGNVQVQEGEWNSGASHVGWGDEAEHHQEPARHSAESGRGNSYGSPEGHPQTHTHKANANAGEKKKEKEKKRESHQSGRGDGRSRERDKGKQQTSATYAYATQGWASADAQPWDAKHASYQGGKGSVKAYRAEGYGYQYPSAAYPKSTEIWRPPESVRNMLPVASPQPVPAGAIYNGVWSAGPPAVSNRGGLFGTPSPPPPEELERRQKEAEAKEKAEREKAEKELARKMWAQNVERSLQIDKERQLLIQNNGGFLQFPVAQVGYSRPAYPAHGAEPRYGPAAPQYANGAWNTGKNKSNVRFEDHNSHGRRDDAYEKWAASTQAYANGYGHQQPASNHHQPEQKTKAQKKAERKAREQEQPRGYPMYDQGQSYDQTGSYVQHTAEAYRQAWGDDSVTGGYGQQQPFEEEGWNDGQGLDTAHAADLHARYGVIPPAHGGKVKDLLGWGKDSGNKQQGKKDKSGGKNAKGKDKQQDPWPADSWQASGAYWDPDNPSSQQHGAPPQASWGDGASHAQPFNSHQVQVNQRTIRHTSTSVPITQYRESSAFEEGEMDDDDDMYNSDEGDYDLSGMFPEQGHGGHAGRGSPVHFGRTATVEVGNSKKGGGMLGGMFSGGKNGKR